MFSQGQLIFGGFFLVAFIIAMIFSYRKDIKIHKEFYKGNYKILLGFLLFIGILFVIKVFFKR
jgi:cytochrome bd-type quinol oxidase subunit 1